ncbi:MAG: hypothetical protein II188_05390, partial [Ruminococcus sp.]|nr:hypothetical protein [Ruminococcus sp.]
MNEVKIKEKITKLADSGMLKKIIFIAGIAGIALICGNQQISRISYSTAASFELIFILLNM